jgi:hypothetical protein
MKQDSNLLNTKVQEDSVVNYLFFKQLKKIMLKYYPFHSEK